MHWTNGYNCGGFIANMVYSWIFSQNTKSEYEFWRRRAVKHPERLVVEYYVVHSPIERLHCAASHPHTATSHSSYLKP